MSEQEMDLINKGERDLTTMATYSIKVYVTPEVAAAYSNYTESVQYLLEILNKQYKRSKIPIKAELHCIEVTQTSEAEGMTGVDVFAKHKGTVTELRGSADVAALFVTKVVSQHHGVVNGEARSFNPPNGDGMVLANNFPESLRTRIVFGHELGHTFGAKHEDGFLFNVGEKKMGTLMHTAEEHGHCCTDDYGFYSNPEVKINGTATGDKEHNVAALIRKHRFLVASFGDESLSTCGGGPLPEPPVSCGAHKAASCGGCPQGHGKEWCHGDCQWVNESCVKN